MRKDTRLKYPGACSLEFQSVMDIFTLLLLKWDCTTKTSTGRGIFGTVCTFFAADEEQGRKTLHRHWQIWTKEMNPTLRNALFDKDPNKREEARKTFLKIVDNNINATYGSQLSITHKCIDSYNQETTIVDTPENIFTEKEPDCFRQARHKQLCNEMKGNIMLCKKCNTSISTTEIIIQSLQRWKDICLPGIRAQDNRPDTKLPISKERLDMAAYLYSYHMNEGCAREFDPYWGMKEIRDILLKYSLKNIQPITLGHVLKKDVSVGFYFHSIHRLIHIYMRIEVTTTITTLYDIVWMEIYTIFIHLWLCSKDQWDVSL